MIKEGILALAVTVTAYIPANNVGAIMEPVLPGLTCAVSRDQKHLLRQWVNIAGVGWRYCNDLTHKRFRKRIDVAVGSYQEGVDIGGCFKSEITQKEDK